MINRLSLLGKINIIVALVFLTVTAVETVLSVQRDMEKAFEIAQERVTEMTNWYFDSLNTLMLTGAMKQRSILKQKLMRRTQVLDARVIRGQPVKQQFGDGYEDEQAEDELDFRALGGESIVQISDGLSGRELTVLTPFQATKNTRGVNCLRCHDVEEGAINGAIRVKFSLEHMDEEIRQITIRKTATNLLLFGIGLVLVNIMLIRWFRRPINLLMEAVQSRAQGDATARVIVQGQDEIGRLGEAFNNMAENVNASSAREQQAGVILQHKVDELCAAMRQVTEGNFNVQIGFGGEGAIGELASSLQVMVDYLKNSIDEKHAAVEVIKGKVDRILKLANQVAEGDLSKGINVKGDDAIAQLAVGVQGMVQSLNTLVTQIKQSGTQVMSSSRLLTDCMSDVESTVENQAETTSNISVTATEISSTTHELLRTMNDVANMADNATNSAIHSHAGLKKLQVVMEQVIASAVNVAEKLEILDERARNISAVVITIAKVADQTNLLSLNASLEAEKAGEYGRGFAAVATEIRRLADQASLSTLDIEQMVNEMQTSVSAGVKTMTSFTDQVRNSVSEMQVVNKEQLEIISLVETMGPHFEALHQSMQFQAQGAEDIHLAMIRLNDEAQNTVESLKKSSTIIHDLKDDADLLQNSVSKFKVSGDKSDD